MFQEGSCAPRTQGSCLPRPQGSCIPRTRRTARFLYSKNKEDGKVLVFQELGGRQGSCIPRTRRTARFLYPKNKQDGKVLVFSGVQALLLETPNMRIIFEVLDPYLGCLVFETPHMRIIFEVLDPSGRQNDPRRDSGRAQGSYRVAWEAGPILDPIFRENV